MKSHGSIFSFNNLLAAAAVTVLLLPSACSEDPAANNALSGPMLRFEVVDAYDRQPSSQSRAAGDTTTVSEYTDVFTLQGETPADTLFLHATVSERADTTHVIGTEVAETRAAPVATATFYDSFGVLTYVYNGSWSETSCRPDYMYNVEVTKASGWTTNYFWPTGGRKVRFFAYAPYNGQGIVLSDKTKAGAPTITYTVPAAVASQNDLLVAAPAAMDGNTSATALLPFGHVLTAVRFVTGDDVLAGKIMKITLKGVYGSATLAMGTPAWSDYGKTANFSQSCSVNVDGSADQEITSAKATFMLLPQTLPAGASIEIAYMDDLTSTQRTLTASIGGAEWPMGKTVTYRISTTSISVVPTFTVTAPADFTYVGGSKDYSVTSYATVSRPGDITKTVAVPWTAEFVEDDGSGGYNVIARPEWLTAFTASGNGGTSAMTFSAAVTAQTSRVSNPHNDVLMAAAPVSGTYDLSTKGGTTPMNTANCYIINAPGTYSLPLVYGNAVKDGTTNSSAYTSRASGNYVLKTFVNHLDAPITDPYIYNNAKCTPKDAVLVWQDEKDLVTRIALSPDKHNITFVVNQATIRQGNAIIAVRNGSGQIMWSWHIWVTDYKLGDGIKTVTNYQNVQYRMMPVNIGWCDAANRTYDARSLKVRFTQTITGASQVITLSQTSYAIRITGNNPYFQFGRKDPIMTVIQEDNESVQIKPCYSVSYSFAALSAPVSIGEAIQNPHVHYTKSLGAWCATTYYNLWSANTAKTEINDDAVVKTIYDPSPAGYHLPASRAFTGFTYDGSDIYGNGFLSMYNSPYTSSADIANKFGWEFYCNKMTGKGSYDTSGGTIFFPASGYRRDIGEGTGIGTSFACWSAGSYIQRRGFGLLVPETSVLPGRRDACACGYAVRPVQD